MAQVGWVFLDQSGGKHRIGLYHGEDSGHVVIHCNLRIIQLDFSVKDSKTYTFFIEDELCEVRMFKEKVGFSYEFFVDKKTDTPLNRVRKKELTRDRKMGAGVIIGFLLIVIGGSAGLMWYNKIQVAKRMARTGISFALDRSELAAFLHQAVPAEAAIRLSASEPNKAIYRFQTADSVYVSGELVFDKNKPLLLSTGFPLHDGDAFQVLYLPSRPRSFYLDFGRPSEPTQRTYLEHAIAAEQAAHPNATKEKSNCIAEMVAKIRGWEQLASIIYQNQTPGNYPAANQVTYEKMMGDRALKQILQTNCPNQ
ncbi:MAG: hypothetical protein IPL65_04835 [Lewinellaceae bacterium]|nr:hypothetical protein [Lewinellaceae bacterium]